MLCSSQRHVVKLSLTLMGACFSASSLSRIHSNYSTENNWVEVKCWDFFFCWFLAFFLSIRETHQARASELRCGSFKQLIFLVPLLAPPLASCFHSEANWEQQVRGQALVQGILSPFQHGQWKLQQLTSSTVI